MLDDITIEVHPTAAQSLKNSAQQQTLVRSSPTAGCSTQIHGVLEGPGSPLPFTVTPGQVHDRILVPGPIAQYETEHVMVDKAYENDALIRLIQTKGAIAVIAPRANRTQPQAYERDLYRERHWMACLIHKLKPYYRIFSQFEKTARMILNSSTGLPHA